MKRIGSRMAVLMAAMTLAAGIVHAAEVFRAHYEISVESQGTDNTVRSTFEARPGEPFTLDLPPNVVAMSVRRTDAENYELQLVVKPKPGKGDGRQDPVLFSHTYRGVLGRPLELRNIADAVKVDGAISVVVLNR